MDEEDIEKAVEAWRTFQRNNPRSSGITNTNSWGVVKCSQTCLMWLPRDHWNKVMQDRWSLNTGSINIKCTLKGTKIKVTQYKLLLNRGGRSIYNYMYLCNQVHITTLWVRILLRRGVIISKVSYMCSWSISGLFLCLTWEQAFFSLSIPVNLLILFDWSLINIAKDSL